MSEDDNNVVSLAAPDPGYVALVGSFIRAVMQLLAGAGILYGVWDDQKIATFAFVIVSLATLSWSFWQKIQARRKAHRRELTAAYISAEAGTPSVVKGESAC